jgi:MFS family permease
MALPATARPTKLLMAALTLLVGAVALCADRARNGDLYLDLFTGRFIAEHGLVSHDPFPTIAQGQAWLNQQWLAELSFYRVGSVFGLTGLTILYAALLAVPLALLLWACRRKGAPMLIALATLYLPGLFAVIHPRPAGFTVLGFSILVVLLLATWRSPGQLGDMGTRPRLALVGIVALFAVWANLHGGFIAGLLLIGLVTVGMAVDRWRGLSEAVAAHRVAMLALTGAVAFALVSLATPLGGEIWSYFASFQNPAIRFASKEWRSALETPAATGYLIVSAAFAAWVWWRTPSPRHATPVLVALGFVVFAALSLRNIIFVAPALAFQVASAAPNRSEHRPRLPVAAAATAGVAAILAVVAWATVLGPPKDQPELGSTVVDYALDHPPKSGRIATYAGVGSYMLWRDPDTPVVIDGRLEHYTADQLHSNYILLRGWRADPTSYAERLGVSAVIAHVPLAIQTLKAHGFAAEFTAPDGTYLVRRGECCATG